MRKKRWDWSMAAARWLFAKPALLLGGATVVLFAVARIPTEIFYARFGVRPEEVGFNSVQVLLQGCTATLVFSLFVGLLYGFLVPVASVVYVEFASRTLRRIPTENNTPLPRRKAIWDRLRVAARISPLLVPVTSVLFAALSQLQSNPRRRCGAGGQPTEQQVRAVEGGAG